MAGSDPTTRNYQRTLPQDMSWNLGTESCYGYEFCPREDRSSKAIDLRTDPTMTNIGVNPIVPSNSGSVHTSQELERSRTTYVGVTS